MLEHVNNAVYSSYFEHRAKAFFADLLDVPLAIVHLEVDLREQIELGETVMSAVSVTDVGETSFTFDHELRVD